MGLASSTPEQTKAFSLPVGAASPLWLAFAGAAGVGVAYWWMTRWMRGAQAIASVAPLLEARAEPVAVVELTVVDIKPEIAALAEPEPEPSVSAKAPEAEVKAEPVAELTKPVELAQEVAAKAKAEPAAEAEKPVEPKPETVAKALKIEAKAEPVVEPEKPAKTPELTLEAEPKAKPETVHAAPRKPVARRTTKPSSKPV
jgi:translation initiation factor IF-2